MTYLPPRHDDRARLADAWAGSFVELDDAVFWIQLAIVRGDPIEPRYCAKYRHFVRAVSEYEQQMDMHGMSYNRD